MLAHLANFAFVAVLYEETSSWSWLKVMARSLREYCQEPLVLVNHTDFEDQLKWAASIPATTVIDNPGGKNAGRHGGGLDVAVAYLRQHGFQQMVCLEPDCLITGRHWLEEMLAAITAGAAMAGPSRLSYGPIHPCPSIWDLKQVPGSFEVSFRLGFPDPKLFSYQGLINWLAEMGFGDITVWLMVHCWDCSIKNWYDLARQGQAVLTGGDGFRHFWGGRERLPEELPQADLALVQRFLY